MMDWRKQARRALREYPRAKKRNSDNDQPVIEAVEFAMKMQSEYYNAQERMRMIRLVYFVRTHTLQGAAVDVEYSIETVKKWNLEILTAVYVAMKVKQGNEPVG